jgi:hypothetical protein
MPTDWREAGRRSDATRVVRLYRRAFDNDAKRLARSRSIEALHASGVQTVVVLWGGGLDAEELVAAGFRVIAVDNGSMTVSDGDREVSTVRKRRALQYAAMAGGYEWRWGDVERYLAEGDGALLDFHGPWSKSSRRAVQAARHMAAVIVTLTPSHDLSADASSAQERQMAYQLFLKMSWANKPRWEAITASGHVRRLTDYHEDQGRHVFVYLLGRKHVRLSVLDGNQRAKMRRDMGDRKRAKSRAHYHRKDAVGKADHSARSRHNRHLRSGVLPLAPCRVCQAVRPPTVCGRTGCTEVVPLARVRGPAFYCSAKCAVLVKADGQRTRTLRARMAAVSGTAAEAISTEEAA